MIKRALQSSLERLAGQYPVVAVVGPRQSGKTTLTRATFAKHKYVLLESPDEKMLAMDDPRLFFQKHANPDGIILDEIQEVPHLLSYMQGMVDEQYRPGYFIITGSQNILMQEKISQTLAGRIALLTLLPLSVNEMRCADMLPGRIEEILFQGLYPRIYVHNLDPSEWLANYVATYVERDARLVINIANLVTFQRFLKLCAGRVGQLLNYTSLANDCGISVNTARAWISLLEASYIIWLVPPFYKSFNRRVVRTPKLHFYDPGLVCALLGVESVDALYGHSMRGAIFETFVLSELVKYRFNQGKKANCYFWRDARGHEVDCLLEYGDRIVPIEIKSALTINQGFFEPLIAWHQLVASEQDCKGYLVYAGDEMYERKHATVVGWSDIDKIIQNQQ
ncbi:MAG: ATP-binding protein [Epsilonproteobacteria bacterium]|nr:ATP-binding protein [Campylobacterota bacterium]